MILRMYELAAADLERLAGWPAEAGHCAEPIRADWPRDRLAIELQISGGDARGAEIPETARRGGMRRLIPWIARKLVAPDAAGMQQLLIRVDGRLQPGSLAEVFRHVDPTHTSLFSFTGAQRVSLNDPLPSASATFAGDVDLLQALCGDQALNLEGGARLRAWAVPPELIAAVLDSPDPGDPKWEEVLARTSLFLTPSATCLSLFVVGPASADDVRRSLLPGT